MKKIGLLVAAAWVFGTSVGFAQEPVIEDPRFPGCEGEGKGAVEILDCAEMKMLQFIFSNLKHPDEAVAKKITGEVEVSFTVATDGSIKSPKITKGLGHGCDEEVLRIVGMMPKWTPGKENGAAKDMETTISVKFK